MRESSIVQIKTEADALEKRFDDFLKYLGNLADPHGKAFDISRNIPKTDSSVSDLRARTAAVSGLIKKFDENGGALVPLSDLNSMVNSSRAILSSIDSLENSVNSSIQSFGEIQSFNFDLFNITFANGQQVEFLANFREIFNNLESYLSSFQTVFQSISPSRASFNFSGAVDALSKIISQANDTRENLQVSLKSANTLLEQINKNQARISAILEESISYKSVIEENYAKSAELLSQITTHNDNAQSLSSVTKDLHDRITAYDVTFLEFQKILDDRNKTFVDGDKQFRELVSKFKIQESEFDRLINKSDQMLSASTVAGLASEFGTIRSDLTRELRESHNSFIWSIVVLAASALPLILFIFAPFIAPFISNDDRIINAIVGITTERNGWQYIGQVMARLVILLPAIWYVTFCSGRYNSLFKLREHYAYKYSMAVAVEGFKKQSPGHEDLVAALVFEQLAFNPADKLGRQPKGPEVPPSPIANLLLAVLRKQTNDEKE